MAVAKRPEVEVPLEGVLERLQPRVRGVFARFRVPREDAEDLLQQALLTYLHKKDTIKDTERWLLGTLRNRCLMYWRGRRRRIYRTVDTAILESVAEPRPPAQEIGDAFRDLEAVINELPPRCRTLLKLRYRLGCEPPEAADRLGYSHKSIYKVMERCFARLTRKLIEAGLLEDGRR